MVKVYLDELSMAEFKKRVEEDVIVMLPVGAVEAHGTHLPLCTDSIQPEYVAERVAERTGAIIAPPLRYGYCSTLKNHPGTISISVEALRAFVYEILSELVRNGLRKIVVLSGHAGGNHMGALALAAKDIVEKHGIDILVLSDYYIAYDIKHMDLPEDDGHAGFVETSRVMAIRPDLVGTPKEYVAPSFPKFKILDNPQDYVPTGVMGDPKGANPEVGKAINDYIIDELSKLIQESFR